MSRQNLRTLVAPWQTRRVVVFRRDDGSFGFEDQRFSLEHSWHPTGRYLECYADSADNAEHEAFVHCIAAPIRDASGSVVAAASCSVPVVMLSYEGLLELLPDLKASTEAISKDLGWISHERNPA